MAKQATVQATKEQIVALWLRRQGLLDLTQPRKLTRRSFVQHLESTGGLQVDSVNVLDRAHYLTLFSRFGSYDRKRVDDWVYKDRVAYEYWGHEASILPASHLPVGLRRMKSFPPESWRSSSYWKHFNTSTASRKRVLKRLREHGPLDSIAFEKTATDKRNEKLLGWGSLMPKEDKRSMQLLWHSGKIAICGRKHFRKIYDLATNVYDEVQAATTVDYHNSWLMAGLSGCGIASEKHLVGYITGPALKSPERKKVLDRNLRSGRIVPVAVSGFKDSFFATEECLEALHEKDDASGTTLICPFDSLLWQRLRAEELLDFRYRIEIYIPEAKREFGYYALPIMHDGRLVGRIDPKLHRNETRLEIKAIQYENWFRPTRRFKSELKETLQRLASFVAATKLDVCNS